MIRNLIKESLMISAEDKVCLFFDQYGARAASDIKEELKEQVELVRVPNHMEKQLPDIVKSILLGSDHNVIIIAIQQEQDIWHRQERKRAKYELNKRLVSIIVPHEVFTDEEFQIDLTLIKELANYVHSELKGKETLIIRTKNGTDVSARIGLVFMENGDYSSGGSGGDFPAGEVGVFVEEGSTSGTLVYDVKVRHLGLVEAEDVVLDVKNDKIIEVKGKKEEEFKTILSTDEILSYISEISIGVNPHIKVYNNASTIIEEKKAGTVHFGHGSNGSYGSRSGSHFDCVIAAPTVYVDGKEIMIEGKYLARRMPESLVGKLRPFGLLNEN